MSTRETQLVTFGDAGLKIFIGEACQITFAFTVIDTGTNNNMAIQ